MAKKPYVVDEKPGKKAWCSCGLSKRQPYCDGAHVGTGMGPVLVEIKVAGPVSWCGCKKTATQPFCDGSHNK
jgi:CDGSH-type Zn-finger protein